MGMHTRLARAVRAAMPLSESVAPRSFRTAAADTSLSSALAGADACGQCGTWALHYMVMQTGDLLFLTGHEMNDCKLGH